MVQLSDLCKEGIAKMKNVILFYYVASKIKNTNVVFGYSTTVLVKTSFGGTNEWKN